MTNCPVLPRTSEVLSTDKCHFKNRETPEQMGKTGLLREQLPSSGERLAAVLRCQSNLKKNMPSSWAHSGAAAIKENQEGGIQE